MALDTLEQTAITEGNSVHAERQVAVNRLEAAARAIDRVSSLRMRVARPEASAAGSANSALEGQARSEARAGAGQIVHLEESSSHRIASVPPAYGARGAGDCLGNRLIVHTVLGGGSGVTTMSEGLAGRLAHKSP